MTRRRAGLWSSSVGTKVLIGLTGLGLVVYLIVHIIGNVMVFFGPTTFNYYSDFLLGNPLLIPIEIGLLAVFAIHVYKTVSNWARNRAARPVNYYQAQKRIFGYGWAGGPSRKSISSSTMIFSGILTFLFIVIHIRHFRFGPEYHIGYEGAREIRDLYRLELEIFSNPLNVLFYEVALLVIGLHLWHGVTSAVTSLGLEHPNFTPWILTIGRAFAVVLTAAFMIIPVWVYLVGAR